MKPLISVIMGVYNLSPRYKRAINSILNQTYRNFEFIICDDKSEDNTLNILNKLAKSDYRIRIIKNNKNMGLGASLNNCLKYARGKYIARMDDDDISNLNRFNKELKFLENNSNYAFVSSSYYIDDGQSKKLTIKKMEEKPTKESFLWNSPFLHPCTMFRASALKKVNGYRVCKETIRAEDYDLYMRLYAAGFKGYNIQIPLYTYYIGLNAVKKYSNFKYNIYTAKVRAYGYKLLGFSIFKSLPYIMKPLLMGILPNKIIYYLRTQKEKLK